MSRIEPKIGEVFEIQGQKYECIEDNRNLTCQCSGFCVFVKCDAYSRKDNKSVVFRRVHDAIIDEHTIIVKDVFDVILLKRKSKNKHE